MRKIEREMIEAIQAKKPYSNDNTRVAVSSDSDLIKVELHGYEIARIIGNTLYLSDCGYQTKTTKSRLNCLLNHFNLPIIYSKNYQWYIGVNVWEGNTSYLIDQDNISQPTEFDAVLGGKSQQPKPHHRVLGGNKKAS